MEEVLYHVTSTEEARNSPNMLTTLFDLLQHLIERLTSNLHHDDRIQFTLSNRGGLDYPISLPLLKKCELSVDELFNEIVKVAQSNAKFKIDDNLEIRIVIVRLPRGGKNNSRRSVIAKKWHRKCTSLVTVTNKDNMCMGRAIGISLAKLVNKLYNGKWGQEKPDWLTNNSQRTNNILSDVLWGQYKYETMSRGNRCPQERFAKWLHETANVPRDRLCGLEEAEEFQLVLDRFGISLNIFSQANAGSIIFGRPKEHEHHIYIYHKEDHYDAIVSVTGFITRVYWCPKCAVGYNEKVRHTCSNICNRCRKVGNGDCRGSIAHCGDCNRYFLGTECFDYHKQHGICNSMKHCGMCNEFLRNSEKIKRHKCGFKHCNVCEQSYRVADGRHRCYMQVAVNPFLLKKKKKKKNRRRRGDDDNDGYAAEVEVVNDNDNDDGDGGADQTVPVYDPDNFQFVFFDFETVTNFDPDNPDMKHCVQVAVAVSVCHNCKDAPVTEICENCREKEVIFYGRNSLEQFCEWLFDNRQGQWTAFAHNSQDEYFLVIYQKTFYAV